MTALDDLFLLRSFVRIAESGSISAAARSLKMPQPTLSRHLKLLEERAGVELARRDTHTMSLTEAGFRFLDDARSLLAMADDAQHRLTQEQGALSGHLRLFSTIDLGQFLVTRIITEFAALHPAITMELSYANRPLRMIEEGYDAGVVVGRVADESVVARPAGAVVRGVYAAPDLAKQIGRVKTPSDLGNRPWVGLIGSQFGEVDRVRLRSQAGRDSTFKIRPKFTVEGATGLREAVASGAGLGLLAEWLADEEPFRPKLVRILPRWHVPGLPVHVVYPGARILSARARAFVEFARDQMIQVLGT